MSRIKHLSHHELDAGTAATLDAVKQKLGMVPNLLSTFAHAPAALNGYLGLGEALGKGALTGRQREIIALTVAQFNQCQYCLSAHSVLGKAAGLSEDEIARARQGTALNKSDDVIANFARVVTANRGVINDEALKTYEQQGLTHSQMVETVANVAMNLLTNYINHLADTEIDFPVVDLAA